MKKENMPVNNTWTTFINGILKMPGAKINREEFLKKTFKELPADQMALCIAEKPRCVVSEEEINKISLSIIKSHTAKVTAISTVSGIPGGITMLAMIPADLANYYFHVVTIGQKLGYLYGYPDMLDEDENLTEDGKIMLTAFIGVMNKVTAARELIRTIATEVGKRVTEETATRIMGNLLSKQIVAQSVEMIARKLGTQITAKSGGRVLSKAIPLVSGVICGAMTYSTFLPQAKRLRDALKSIS